MRRRDTDGGAREVVVRLGSSLDRCQAAALAFPPDRPFASGGVPGDDLSGDRRRGGRGSSFPGKPMGGSTAPGAIAQIVRLTSGLLQSPRADQVVRRRCDLFGARTLAAVSASHILGAAEAQKRSVKHVR